MDILVHSGGHYSLLLRIINFTKFTVADILVPCRGYFSLQWRILKFTVADIKVYCGGYKSLLCRICVFLVADI